MEMTELQNMWTQHNKNISENTRINKQILKTILITKTERKMNWMKAKAIVNLILPLVLLATIFIPRVSIRVDSSFIFGALLFGIVFILGYYWSVQYFLRVMRVDLRKSITSTKKDVVELEKYEFKITKLGYMLIPFALIGMFMMLEFPFFTKSSFVPVSLIITVMIVSIYITFKFSIIERFRTINREIVEIEKLEIE
ncbi:MAG: hypothetical protein JEZ14_26250 [Marinilabiliaceae bacterium]|nr:hypothetical protein [Marinilabiliaceae bacterium]